MSASLRIRKVHPYGFSLDLWSRPTTSEALPDLAKMLVQFRVFYIAKAFAGDDHYVPAGQDALMKAERIAHQTLEAIALNGELYGFFSDHQAQAGVIESVLAGKEQQTLAGHLA